MFDHTHELFGRTAFKQAMAFLIDGTEVANVRGPNSNGPPVDQSIHPNFRERYHVPPLEGNLIQYGKRSKPDRARDRLESIGCSKEDGTWYGPDGDQIVMDVHSPTGDWSTMANTVAGQLDNFGLTSNVLTEEGSTYFSKYVERSYPLAIEIWQGGTTGQFQGLRRNMVGFGGGTMGYPTQPEAPPVGEPDGELQTYDIKSLFDAALRAEDEETFLETIQTLLWIQNYELPCICLMQGTMGGMAFDADGWSFPASDSSDWGWKDLALLFKKGMLQPQ